MTNNVLVMKDVFPRKNNFTNERFNIIIFLLILGDFLLTYLGINHFEWIEEANTMMVWLFKLPFLQGLSVRIAMGLFIFMLLKIIQLKGHKYYKKLVVLILIIQAVPYICHLIWITSLVSFRVVLLSAEIQTYLRCLLL